MNSVGATGAFIQFSGTKLICISSVTYDFKDHCLYKFVQYLQKNRSDPSILCQIYVDLPFLGR